MRYIDDAWRASVVPQENVAGDMPWYESLRPYVGSPKDVRDVAVRGSEVAVAALSGLYLGDGAQWQLALPRQGARRWAPVDVRAVCFDRLGRLWFVSPHGVGCRLSNQEWRLFTGADGLPFNDFTCMAAGPQQIWFGTTNGAICLDNAFAPSLQDAVWRFRQGGRWLLANRVRDVVVDAEGSAWIATARGVSQIALRETTLSQKAEFYHAEIEKYHRRTKFGYVNPSRLKGPGNKAHATPEPSDNDGFNTGLYLAAVSLGYAHAGTERLLEDAHNAFRALQFLGQVTQGGTHPAPAGFVARNIIPTTNDDPNRTFDLDYDMRRQRADALWKIMRPRCPVDSTGKWYWKCDSSSDELDGHFFGYAIYYDHVCKSVEQQTAVRSTVRSIVDHLLAHDLSLVDHDGQPTRWAHFAPDDLNRNGSWCDERGLNSYSILTYLSIAHHVTGDSRYREVYEQLAHGHGYAMNGMTQPKALPGPDGPGHQPDDNMSFMNYYHLIRYETDPSLLSMYQHAIHQHWKYERLERNAIDKLYLRGVCQRKGASR